MRTVREYVQWALGTARLWRLNDGLARMIAAVAAHANEHGECTASNERLALLVDRHIDTARRLLRELRRLGLIERAERDGRRVLKLNTERLPAEQLELDLARLEADEAAARVGAQAPRAPSAQVGAQAPTPLGAQAPGHPGRLSAHQKGIEGLRSGVNPAHDHDDGVDGATASRFDEVLAILGEAKPEEILIDDRAILAALEAHPETAGYDHVKAARQVVMWTHDPCGGPAIASAPRLLWSVLDKQHTAVAAAATGDQAGGHGRFTRQAEPERERPWWDGALARAINDQPATSGAPA